MDQNFSNLPEGGQIPEPAVGPLIRTMAKDIETLSQKPQKEEVAFQPAGYEPPPEMPLGMAPPSPPTEIAVPPTQAMPSPVAPIPPEPTSQMPSPPPPPPRLDEASPTPPPVAPPALEETIISEKTLTEFVPPQPPKKDIKKLAIIAGIVGLGIVFGLAGWFLYPKIFPTSTPLPTPIIITPTPVVEIPTATPTPTPIVFFLKMPEKTVVLDIGISNILTKNELINALEQERNKPETVGTLKIIDLRENGKVIFFDQFATLIGFTMPGELKSLISPEFKLFINSHAQEGSQVGLVLFVSDPMEAKEKLKNWENTISADLADLFLKSDRGEKTEFKDGNYRGVAIRYLTFSKPPFALDYGIYQNFLIISTSRFSFANAVDHILGKEE